MKGNRVAACAAALFLLWGAAFYAPAASTDLGKLLPVEMLWVSAEGGKIAVEGEGVRGVGDGWEAALADLRESAGGTVFLETVERVVVALPALRCLPDLCSDGRLRPAVRLYLLAGGAGEELAAFTEAHESPATIENGERPPLILEEEEGRYRLA